MEAKPIPEGYQALMPYLILPQAGEFAAFAEEVFGAEQTLEKLREGGAILHAELKFRGQTIMYADAVGEWSASPGGFFVYVENARAAYDKALKLGATSLMEPAQQSYGFQGGLRDPFGNTWWITEANT